LLDVTASLRNQHTFEDAPVTDRHRVPTTQSPLSWHGKKQLPLPLRKTMQAPLRGQSASVRQLLVQTVRGLLRDSLENWKHPSAGDSQLSSSLQPPP
jgi:hypothetical protein